MIRRTTPHETAGCGLGGLSWIGGRPCSRWAVADTRLVMIDVNSLADRLYADALAADLRLPGRFVAAVTKVGWDDIEPHIRKRAEAHRGLCRYRQL